MRYVLILSYTCQKYAVKNHLRSFSGEHCPLRQVTEPEFHLTPPDRWAEQLCLVSKIDVVDNGCYALQAEKQVQELTTELQKVEDDLDACESRLADVTLQLEQAEQQMDENERCYTIFVVLS